MKKRKIVRNLFGVLLATMTSVNTILPAYAEENVNMPQEGNSLSVGVAGDGVVTLNIDNETYTISSSDKFEQKVKAGTNVKMELNGQGNTVLSEFNQDDNPVEGFKSGKNKFEYAFTMNEKDTKFTTKFSHAKTTTEKVVSVEQKSESNTEEEKNTETTETDPNIEYFKENVNRKYTNVSNQFDKENIVWVKQTLVNGKNISDKDSLDTIMTDIHKTMKAFLNMVDNYVYAYNLDDNSDYYVVKANTMQDDKSATVREAVFAKTDTDANVYDDCIYDENTGIAYIPKKHFINDEGKKAAMNVQVQFMQVLNSKKTKSEVDVQIDDGDTVTNKEVKALATDISTEVKIADPNKLEAKDIKVMINGAQASKNDCSFDSETGKLYVNKSPSMIESLQVETDTSASDANAISAQSAEDEYGIATCATDSNIPTYQDRRGTTPVIKVKGTPHAGFTCSCKLLTGYAAIYDNAGYVYGTYESSYSDSAALSLMYNMVNNGDIDLNNLVQLTAQLNWNFSFNPDKGGQGLNMTDPWGTKYTCYSTGDGYIPLKCAHVSSPNTGHAYTYNDATLNNNCASDVMISVLKVDTVNKRLIIGLTTPSKNTQAGFGIYAFKYEVEEEKGKLCIRKTSAEPDVTNGNKYYSVKGAQYGVYKSESDAKNDANRVKTLTIGKYSAEYPDWSEEVELLAGTYYVKEIKRPTNNSYELNPNIQKVTITAGQTSNIGYHNEFNEKPIYEKFRLYKKSADPSMTDGNDSYDISGAQYGIYKSESDAKNDTNRIDTLITKSNGESNEISVSFGDYYIKEVANPKGYALDPKVYTVSVDRSSDDAYSFMPDAELAQSSTVEMAIAKLDAETNKNIPQGSASLEGALYKVSYYKGDYAEGVNPAKSGVQPTRYWVVKTDKEGKAYLKDEYITEKSGDLYKNSEGKVALPLGTVTVEEIKAPAGYYLNKGKVTVRKLKGSGTKENIQEFVKIEDTEQVVRFYVDKVQEGTDVKISNVLFLHTKPDGSTEKLKTDADGQIVLTGPEPGVHSIEEIQTTDGYEINKTKVEFEVVYNGEVKLLTNLANTGISFGKRNNSSEDKKITVENKVRPYTMQIVKTNQFNKKLKGAEFTIYEDAEGKTKIQTLSTDANGILQFGSLKNLKTYYFKETKAPKGYRIPEKELNTMHSIRVDAIPEIGQFDYYVDGVKYTASQTTGDIHLEGTKNDRIVSIHIVNMTGVKLPETGSVLMIPTILLGAGCVAYVVYEECKKKKKSQNSSSEEETESKKDE